MNLRLEPIEHNADDRRASQLQKLLGSLYFVEIGASGADDQKNRIHHAGEEQRITSGQHWRRIQEHVAEPLRDRFERRTRLGPFGGSQ